jgi:hypothetical protein
MNLSLRRIEHVGVEFAANVKNYSTNRNKGYQYPGHRPSAQSVICCVCEARKVTRPESPNELVDTNPKKVETNRQVRDSKPSKCQTTHEAFPFIFVAGKGWPSPVNNSLAFVQNLHSDGINMSEKSLGK